MQNRRAGTRSCTGAVVASALAMSWLSTEACAPEDEVQIEHQQEAIELVCPDQWVYVQPRIEPVYLYHVPGFSSDDEIGGHPVTLNATARLDFTSATGVKALVYVTMSELGGDRTYLGHWGMPYERLYPAWTAPSGCDVLGYEWTNRDSEARPPADFGWVQVASTGRSDFYANAWYPAQSSDPAVSALRGANCITDTQNGAPLYDSGQVYCLFDLHGFWAHLGRRATSQPADPPRLHLAPTDLRVSPGGSLGALQLSWTPQGDGVDSYEIEIADNCSGESTCALRILASGVANSATSYAASLRSGTWYTARVCSLVGEHRLCSNYDFGQARVDTRPRNCPAGWARCDDLSCKPRASQCEFLP
jgi:hypothetical protein